jgi:phosphonopyruvate decarboxylase
MIDAERFISAAGQRGFGLYTGVPCSYLTPFINYVIDSPGLRYVGAANEGDAVAIAAGAELGGMRSVAIFQNSGLGNAVSPLTSLTHVFRIPVLLIPTLRGQPGGPPDEPQHGLMGRITTELLELMQIPWEYFPDSADGIDDAMERAVRQMDIERRPYALVMRKGSVSPTPLRSTPRVRHPKDADTPSVEAHLTRQEAIGAIRAGCDDTAVLIATTGYTGRELFAAGDRDGQLYMVGSMGCASSLGFGLAVAQPHRRVVVLDGDGAALMRLGALATIGYERPANLVHVLLDNQIHESTGAQSTVSHSIDFCRIAAACGYPRVHRAGDAGTLREMLQTPANELTFIHVPIRAGVPADLGRPTVTPVAVAERLRRFCAHGSDQ